MIAGTKDSLAPEAAGAPSSPETTCAEAMERSFALEVFAKRNITLVRGRGAEVWDAQGRRYLDCVAGIGVASVGHANEAVAQAVAAQARVLVACAGIFYNDRRAALLGKLAEIAPEGLVRGFLCSSGAEAVEAALKFARLHTARTKVVAAMRGFHGRTMGALSATHKSAYRDGLEPLLPGFSFVPFNDPAKLRDAVDEGVAAVLLEPVQGEGGVRPAKPDYLRAAREACDESGALLVFDEVQTGFCRTGRMFACQRHGVVPDMLCLAKGMGGGLPVGAVVSRERLRIPPGKHGTTFGGNPLACAAALAAITFMEERRLAERAETLGMRFRERFVRKRPVRVRDVRQAGLMIGIELRERCGPFLSALADRGVLALSAGPTVVRLLPPLVATEDQVDEITAALQDVLA